MSYLVMECHPGYAVLLDEAGRFVRAANLRYEVGQTVCNPVLWRSAKAAVSGTALWLRRGELPLPASAEAYSIKTLRRVWLDSCHKRQPEPMAKLPETPGCAEAEGHFSRDDARLVRQLVARLPADQRRVVAMRDLEGLSYAEIAQQTGLTQTNIRSLVSRGRKTVREQFKHIEDHGR